LVHEVIGLEAPDGTRIIGPEIADARRDLVPTCVRMMAFATAGDISAPGP
jgi:hypothetical protein